MSVTIGRFNVKEIAAGEPQVLAEYVTQVFGGQAAWMSWRHSRQA